MDLAWSRTSDAFDFAFGIEQGFFAQIVVLLHKDRLDDIAKLLESSRKFQGRWRGLITRLQDTDIAFILTPKGASDVGDCILHLAAIPPRYILFTGTCGGLNPEIKIGQVCWVLEGWDASGFIPWLDNPIEAVSSAKFIASLSDSNIRQYILDFNLRLGFDLKLSTVFTTASQAFESKKNLKVIQDLGADIIDMETSISLATARRCGLQSSALLWCTDRPQDNSYYVQPNEKILHTRQKMWENWPKILITAATVLSKRK